jgi:hypothetical protein
MGINARADQDAQINALARHVFDHITQNGKAGDDLQARAPDRFCWLSPCRHRPIHTNRKKQAYRCNPTHRATFI